MTHTVNSQNLQSGIYDNALIVAVDSTTGMLTGYYENYTGWDEESKSARFSCIFYLEGKITDNRFKIKTHYPNESDSIMGFVEINSDSSISIQLEEEHGGCWNVEHFVDKPNEFSLDVRKRWIGVGFVTVAKTYFYSEKNEEKKRKAYLVKNDFVAIEKIEGNWAYCVYQGNSVTEGWIKLYDLN
jgi:hypothetical protein